MRFANLRRRAALLICPELTVTAGQSAPAGISPRTEQIIRLGQVFLAAHNDAQTFTQALGLVVGRGQRRPRGFVTTLDGQRFAEVTRRQAQWKAMQNRPYVTMNDDVYHGMLEFFAADWPASLPWPSDIPRPEINHTAYLGRLKSHVSDLKDGMA